MKHNFSILTDEYRERFSDPEICASVSLSHAHSYFLSEYIRQNCVLEGMIQPRNCRMVELMVMLRAYVSHCHRAVRLA